MGAVSSILGFLSSTRVRVSTEQAMQDDVQSILEQMNVTFIREARIGKKDIIDFLAVGGIGIECKVKKGWSKMQVYKQLERYCQSDQIKIIVLLTSMYMTLPAMIEGKRTHVIHAGRAWL